MKCPRGTSTSVLLGSTFLEITKAGSACKLVHYREVKLVKSSRSRHPLLQKLILIFKGVLKVVMNVIPAFVVKWIRKYRRVKTEWPNQTVGMTPFKGLSSARQTIFEAFLYIEILTLIVFEIISCFLKITSHCRYHCCLWIPIDASIFHSQFPCLLILLATVTRKKRYFNWNTKTHQSHGN